MKKNRKNQPRTILASETLEGKLQFIEAGLDSEFEMIEAAKDGDEKSGKRFKMLAYSGGPIRQRWSRIPIVVDLESMKVTAKARPILRDHDMSRVVGHSEEIQNDRKRLRLSGSLSAANEHSREVYESARNGFPWQASIGATAEEYEFVDKGQKTKVNGRTFRGPIYVARKTTLLEVSFTALGADDNTSAKVAATHKGKDIDMGFDAWIKAQGFNKEDLTDEQLATLQLAYDAQQGEGAGGDDDNSRQVAANATSQGTGEEQNISANKTAEDHSGDIVASMRAAAGAESDRINAINALEFDNAELKAKAVKEGWDAQKAELELLRADRSTGPAIHAKKSSPRSAQTIEAALLASVGLDEDTIGKHYDEKTVEASQSKDMRGYSIQALCYDVIQAAGGHAPGGIIGDSFIRAALEADRTIKASSGFSTVSLSGILGNTANKIALASYLAVPRTAHMIAEEVPMKDFKSHTSYRLTASGSMELVGQDGELKSADLAEQSYSNQLATYGRIFALTRQQIINDDLGAFMNIPRLIGRQGALSLEEVFYTLLLSNPSSHFSSGNNNYFEGSTTNLQIDSLTTAEQMFLDQVDSEGKPIVLAPSILLVPSSLKVTAEQLYSDLFVNETTTANKGKPNSNPHAGKFKPVATPYLNNSAITGYSATAWYLFADPRDVAAAQIGYLNGQKTPTIESGDADFDTLGIQFRGYFDFGVAMGDKAAAVKSKGAA